MKTQFARFMPILLIFAMILIGYGIGYDSEPSATLPIALFFMIALILIDKEKIK